MLILIFNIDTDGYTSRRMAHPTHTFRRQFKLAIPFGFAAAVLASACAEDEIDSKGDGSGGTAGEVGAGGSSAGSSPGGSSASGGSAATGGSTSSGGSGGSPNGTAGAGGVPTETEESWIVGGWLSTEEGWFGYLTLLDDLSAGGEVDLGKVHQFDGDTVYASAGNGVVLVGQEGLSTIERWAVNDAGTSLAKNGEIDLEYYGVTSTVSASDIIQFIDAETAWYFDPGTYQVIVFDPTTMTTEGDTIDFSGMMEQDYNLTLGNVSRLGDSLVISAQYWDADWNSLSLTRAAIIDIDSHEVSYADDTRCGSTRSHAHDSAGNLYIGAHPGESLWEAAGLANEDAPKPCLVRINVGEAEFDDEYYVNLEEASGGEVVGGFMQGEDNHAYVYQYTGDIADLTAENFDPLFRGNNWALARIELGNEAESYTLVDNYDPSTAYGTSFGVTVGGQPVRFVISANEAFASGKYYDMTDPTDAAEALSFPGFPGAALNY